MLKQRIITGTMLAVLAFLALRFLPTELFALFSMVFMVGLGAWEWAGLTGCFSAERRMMGAMTILLASIPLVFLRIPTTAVLWVSVPIWFTALIALVIYPHNAGFYKRHALPLRIGGIFVLLPAWYALFKLHAMDYRYVFYVLTLVAVADTAAYFTGRSLGKHKLAPALSPGKTKEGVSGAVMATLAWAFFGSYWLELPQGKGLYFILLSMLCVFLSVIGDLFESLLKREAGVKDSGIFLPGHGGVLDRIDGLLAVAPIFTLGMIWIL